MGLASPSSAILSAVIFNALIIVFLIPLALKGVRYRAVGAAALLRRNLLIYGLGGVIVPFIGIKVDRHDAEPRSAWPEGAETMISHCSVPPSCCSCCSPWSPASLYPLVVTGVAQLAFPDAGRRQPGRPRRQGGRLVADRPGVQRPQVLLGPAVGHRADGLQRAAPPAARTRGR